MPPIRLSATIEPERVERYIEARLKDSFQARPRGARSDQCSAERICGRTWTGVGAEPGATDPTTGDGAGSGGGPALRCSNVIERSIGRRSSRGNGRLGGSEEASRRPGGAVSRPV